MTTLECTPNLSKYDSIRIMTIEFAQIVSTIDQRPETTEPVPVSMDQNDAISGIEHSNENPADIRIVEPGTYVVITGPQVGRTSGEGPSSVDFWLRKNGTDIPNSNVRLTLKNSDHKDVIVNQMMMPFKAGDILNMMMAVEKTGEGLGIEAIRTEGQTTNSKYHLFNAQNQRSYRRSLGNYTKRYQESMGRR